MADKLRSLYRQIRADEVEMARYRSRLAECLPNSRPLLTWRPLLAGAGVLAAALLIAAVFLPRNSQETAFSQSRLDELRELAAQAPSSLISRATTLAEQGRAEERWNALMLLCLTSPGERSVIYAAQGVQEDPRPEFRFFYLELLLDRADEYRYNPQRIEELMDREDDRQCLRLYRSLLHLST
jgi:hypothetical protein